MNSKRYSINSENEAGEATIVAYKDAKKDYSNALYTSLKLNAVATFGGEALQAATFLKIRDYNFVVGHLSDVGLAGAFATEGLTITKDMGPRAKLLSVTIPTIAFTIREYFPVIPVEATVDHWDVACYWLGAGLVYTGVNYYSDKAFRSKVKSSIKKLNPFKKNKSGLDKLVE